MRLWVFSWSIRTGDEPDESLNRSDGWAQNPIWKVAGHHSLTRIVLPVSDSEFGGNTMEITKTFVNKFRFVMRAKVRWFLRRSIFRYATAVALMTYGIHGHKTSIEPMDMAWKGLRYFAALCAAVLTLHIIAAAVQSRRVDQRTVTFTEDDVIVDHNGEIVRQDWDWILSAEDSPRMISFLVQESPRLELYLPKTELEDDEYDALRGWLVSHGKLDAKNNVAEQGDAPRDERKQD